MTETEWLACSEPMAMLVFLRNGSGRAKLRKTMSRLGCQRKQRLFLAACARRNWSIIRDNRSQQAVVTAERFADGLSSAEELDAAHDLAVAAYKAVRSTPNAAAYCAACTAAEVARADFRQGFSICIYGADVATLAPAAPNQGVESGTNYDDKVRSMEKCAQTELLRDIFGNPFRPVTADPSWLTSTVVQLAQGIYQDRAFDRMPILADALQDAGCDNAEILDHCRGPGPHVRGCFVVDLLLGKE